MYKVVFVVGTTYKHTGVIPGVKVTFTKSVVHVGTYMQIPRRCMLKPYVTS